MAMAEDLSLFFDTEEHAVSVKIDGDCVVGVLMRGYEEVSGMVTTDPVFRCATADLVNIDLDEAEILVHYDTATCVTTRYVIRGAEADGTGLSLVRLEVQ